MNSPRKNDKKRSLLFKRISQNVSKRELVDQFSLELALNKNKNEWSFKKVKLNLDYNDDREEERDLMKTFVAFMNKKSVFEYRHSKYELIELNDINDQWLLGYRNQC